MSDRPIEEKHHTLMNATASALANVFEGYGFALLVFEMGNTDGMRTNYISNANRVDMITAMKEFIARNEGRMHDAPGATQ